MSISRHHVDWLNLVETSGPSVSLQVLMRVFPQGLEPRDPAQAKALRAAYEEWRDNPTAPGKQRRVGDARPYGDARLSAKPD